MVIGNIPDIRSITGCMSISGWVPDILTIRDSGKIVWPETGTIFQPKTGYPKKYPSGPDIWSTTGFFYTGFLYLKLMQLRAFVTKGRKVKASFKNGGI